MKARYQSAEDGEKTGKTGTTDDTNGRKLPNFGLKIKVDKALAANQINEANEDDEAMTPIVIKSQ